MYSRGRRSISLSLICLFFLIIISSWQLPWHLPTILQRDDALAHCPHSVPPPQKQYITASPPPDPYNPAKYVRGAPTLSFRDNLRPEVQYATAWFPGGFTNDVMGFANLIYVAKLADRVPILPPFAGYRSDFFQAGYIPFGDVFDIPRLRKSLRMPIIEWRDVKQGVPSGEKDRNPDALGCWSLWAPYDENKRPRDNFIVRNLSLDLSYTPIKEQVKLTPMADPNEVHVDFWKLVRLSYHSGYLQATQENKPVAYDDYPKPPIPPDEQLMCFDFMYYVSAVQPYEWEQSYSPGWKTASHLRWNPQLVATAQAYLARLFRVPVGGQLPHFISIHIRRDDFQGACPKDISKDECFAPLSAYAIRIREVEAEIVSKYGYSTPIPVVVTSDERDPIWWKAVRDQGWLFVDHGLDGEDTATRFSQWHTVLLDVVFQSMGTGFVGTEGSTMSLLARRRVEDWNGGVTRTVKWGRIGADDH